jgi:hypothetical protein
MINEIIMEPVWYYNTTWDTLVKEKIKIKYIIK